MTKRNPLDAMKFFMIGMLLVTWCCLGNRIAQAEPQVTFTAAYQTATENQGTLTLYISLSALSDLNVLVPYTVGGSASLDGTDHTLEDGVIVIEAGSAVGSLVFSIMDDDIAEGDEFILITLGVPTNGELGAVTIHTVTIIDDDAAPSVEWAEKTREFAENVGTITLSMIVNDPGTVDLTVPYTVRGTASLDGTDHDLPEKGTITIPAGQETYDFIINLFDDTFAEEDETIVITLGSGTNAAPGNILTTTVTIVDNDADQIPPLVTMLGEPVMTLLLGEAYTDPGATATDNMEGDLTEKIQVTSTVNVTVAGTYHVSYSVTDFSGNTSQQTRIVHVTQTPPIYQITTAIPAGAVMDQDGFPIEGVTVACDATTAIVKTLVDGTFTFPRLFMSGRTYYLTFTKSGYITATRKYTVDEPLSIVLVSAETYLAANYDVIDGMIWSYNGTPLKGAIIELDRTDLPAMTFTDDNGEFKLAVNRLAMPYAFTIYRDNYVTSYQTLPSETTRLNAVLTPKTRLLVTLPDSAETLQAARDGDMVQVTLTADPPFTGAKYELGLTLTEDIPVFTEGQYIISHTPFEDFAFKVVADTSEDNDVRTSHFVETDVIHTVFPASTTIIATQSIQEVTTGFPLIIRSSNPASAVWIAIPADGLQGEFIPSSIRMRMVEYDQVASDWIQGKIVTIEVTDDKGKPLGKSTGDDAYALKKIFVTMNYGLPITREGLEGGMDVVRHAATPRLLMDDEGSTLSAEQVTNIDSTTVTFWIDQPGAVGFGKATHFVPDQTLKTDADGGGCFIGTLLFP